MEEKMDKLGGTFDEKKGEAKEQVGEFRGDESQEAEGQMDQLKGNVKKGVADAKEKVGDLLDGNARK